MSELEAVQPAEQLPPEPVQPEQAEAPQAETVEQDADETQDPEPPKPRGVQKRIDELTRDKRQAQREAEHWRQVALAQLGMTEPAAYDEPPMSAADAYDPGVTDVRAAVQAELQREQTAAKVRGFVDIVGDPDVADFLTSPTSPLPQPVWDVMLALPPDEGRTVAAWLANNQDKAAQIAKLPPHLQALEIVRSVGPTRKPAAPAPKKTSTAPAPAPTVGAGSVVLVDESAMNTEQWMKWRQSQLRS